jgi:hypothetical protein
MRVAVCAAFQPSTRLGAAGKARYYQVAVQQGCLESTGTKPFVPALLSALFGRMLPFAQRPLSAHSGHCRHRQSGTAQEYPGRERMSRHNETATMTAEAKAARQGAYIQPAGNPPRRPGSERELDVIAYGASRA